MHKAKFQPAPTCDQSPSFRDRQGITKNLCDKGFAELSGELSGVICLQTLALLGNALELFRKVLVVLFVRLFGYVSPFRPLKIK